MLLVTRIFHSNTRSDTGTPSCSVLSREDLLLENAGSEDFVDDVWRECEKYGWYNDSDRSSDVVCLYVKGAASLAP